MSEKEGSLTARYVYYSGRGATGSSEPSQCPTSPTLRGRIGPRSSPQTEGDGPVRIRPRSQIETMDRLSFMAAIWKKRLGLNVTAYLKSSRRNSTNNQQQIAWKRLQTWLRNHPGKLVNDRTILEFLIHLHNSN